MDDSFIPRAVAPPTQTQDELVREAEALIGPLHERIGECEGLRSLPPSTAADLRRTGLARILQPRRFGGAEAPLVTMVDVLLRIGFGCGSTAWSLAQYIMHNYMIARWPEAAQAAVWGEAPDALVSGILIPLLGKAKRVEGGFHLSGRWPFVSGVNSSDWCVLSGMAAQPRGAGPPIETYFLVPTRALRIIDTWHAVGLKGSASNDIEVQDLFVPDFMTLAIADLKGNDSAARSGNPMPLYRPPVYMLFGILLSSAVLGMAEFMFEEYLTQSRNRVTLMSGKDVGTYQAQQIKIGEASASLQAAEALLRADCDEIGEFAERAHMFSDMERSNYRCNAAFAGRLAFATAGIVWDLSGALAAYETNDIGRVFRDIAVASRHIAQNWDANATEHGRARIKLPLTNPSL
jgi:alkylation response protein AidB-like acyl-CoA dehydrogenase